MVKKAIVKGMIGLAGLGIGATSCNPNYDNTDEESALRMTKELHPTADSVSINYHSEDVVRARVGMVVNFDDYAIKKTDSAAVKQIKEKYAFQLTQYEQAKEKLYAMWQKADNDLLQAASKGDTLGVRQALENGAYINAQDAETGNTALINVLQNCASFGKAFQTAKYLVNEPNFKPYLENKEGINAADILKSKEKSGHAEWESIARKLSNPTPDKSRQRGNSEAERLANQLVKTYTHLLATYGKEMTDALGYEYKGHFEYVARLISGSSGEPIPSSSSDKGMEIINNEDGSKDTLEIKNREDYIFGMVRLNHDKHPIQKSKLKLQPVKEREI